MNDRATLVRRSFIRMNSKFDQLEFGWENRMEEYAFYPNTFQFFRMSSAYEQVDRFDRSFFNHSSRSKSSLGSIALNTNADMKISELRLSIFDTAQPRSVDELYKTVRILVDQLVWLASKLADMNHLAYTDHLSGLPNSRAAANELDMAMRNSRCTGEPLSILLIDGDDLRLHNNISYSRGDEMIRSLGRILERYLRSGDFLARWRMGDEFLLIMPSTTVEQAMKVGHRVRGIVERESLKWRMPVTISGGVATFPDNGDTQSELLSSAEEANHRAKSMGKNRILSASLILQDR